MKKFNPFVKKFKKPAGPEATATDSGSSTKVEYGEVNVAFVSSSPDAEQICYSDAANEVKNAGIPEPQRYHAPSEADVCFLVDCTSSMQPYIDLVRLKTAEIMDNLKALHPTWTLRFAFLGYRDYKDEPQFEHVGLCEDMDDFKTCVRNIPAKGGGDIAEDVHGGLKETLKLFDLTDKKRLKIVFHFADAPSHGRSYYDPDAAWPKHKTADDHPEFDSDETKMKSVMEEYALSKIEFFFLELNEHTRTMSKKMASWYNEYSPRRSLKVVGIDTDADKFVALLTKNISVSITLMSKSHNDDAKK